MVTHFAGNSIPLHITSSTYVQLSTLTLCSAITPYSKAVDQVPVPNLEH